MALTNTFREIAIKNAQKQMSIVDALTEDAPILDILPMQPTSDGFNHTFEKLLEVQGAQIVDLDEAPGAMYANTELGSTHVDLISGIIEVGQDKLKGLRQSPEEYFAKQLLKIMRATGAEKEAGILYNYLRASAIAAGNAVAAGGTSGTNYSIVAVRWEEDQFYGLYDPSGYGDGKMFQLDALSGGNLYKNSTGVPVYGMQVKSGIGVLTANPRNAAAIVNIDISAADPTAWEIPTNYQIDQMLSSVRATASGRTMIFCHYDLLSAIFGAVKDTKTQMDMGETGISREVYTWNGIPLIPTYNFLKGTEPKVTL